MLEDGDSEQATAVIENAVKAVENTEYDSSADLEEQIAAIYEIADAAEAGLEGERFMDGNPVLRKDFDDITSDDESALKKALEDFAELSDAVKDYLDGKAQEQGYSSFESLIKDEINKSLFEQEKEEIISQTEQLVKEHDGESVRDVLDEQKDLINSITYEPCTDDDNRNDYAKGKSEELKAAGATAKTEIEHAQAQQRTINSAIEELEAMIADNRYSDEQEAAMQDIINNLKDSVNGVSSSGDGSESAADMLEEYLAGAIADLVKVPVTSVITGDIKISDDGALTTADGTGDYGEDNAEGVWGVVSNNYGMPSDIVLVIDKLEDEREKEVESALKNGNLAAAAGSEFEEEDLSELFNGKEVKSVLDIYLLQDNVKITEFNGYYNVKVLMDSEMRSMTGLQVVYIDDEGNVQVYKTTVEDGKYLVFTTNHFSEFYILGDSTLNLWWLIIVLSIVVLAEIAALLMLILKRKDNRQTAGCTAIPVALLALIIVPSPAIAICITLGVAAVVLGVAIAVVAVRNKKKSVKQEEISDKD